MPDRAAPIVELLAGTETDSENLPRDPAEVVRDAVSLLGNAVTQTSKIRWKRVLRACNKDIQDLADENDLLKEAAPQQSSIDPLTHAYAHVHMGLKEEYELVNKNILQIF